MWSGDGNIDDYHNNNNNNNNNNKNIKEDDVTLADVVSPALSFPDPSSTLLPGDPACRRRRRKRGYGWSRRPKRSDRPALPQPQPHPSDKVYSGEFTFSLLSLLWLPTHNLPLSIHLHLPTVNFYFTMQYSFYQLHHLFNSNIRGYFQHCSQTPICFANCRPYFWNVCTFLKYFSPMYLRE